MREVKSLQKLDHQNIIKLKAALNPDGSEELFLVFEFVDENIFDMYRDVVKRVPFLLTEGRADPGEPNKVNDIPDRSGTSIYAQERLLP